MAYGDQLSHRDRLIAGSATAVLTVLIGAALLAGWASPGLLPTSESISAFNVAPEPPPPPPAEQPRQDRAPREEGAAAPPNRRATPRPVVAPPPKLPPITNPPPAAPVAGTGPDSEAGAAERPGPGTGAGGIGNGLGAGQGGNGTGGGGGGQRARHVRGTIRDRDYPRNASRERVGGTVTVRFTVQTDGRVRGCSVMQSSGNADLDATTCRLIEERFRYEPARNAAGEPIASETGWRQDWWLEPRR